MSLANTVLTWKYFDQTQPGPGVLTPAYLSVQSIQGCREVRLFQELQKVLFLQETLECQDDLAVRGIPSVLRILSPLCK